MELPPPSQLLLQAEASSAPPFFQPISAASILNGMIEAHQSKHQAPLSIGIRSIDSEDGVLGGGIPQGCVIGLSSDLGEGSARVLALRLMIRDLLRYDNRHQRAMVVDTTGTFPLVTLLEIIKGCVGEINDGTTKTPFGQRMPWREKVIVEGLLERIGITRVFDLEGVWDAIGEVRCARGGKENVMEEAALGGEAKEETKEETKGVGQGEEKEWSAEKYGLVGNDKCSKVAEGILKTIGGGGGKQEGDREKMNASLDERVWTPDKAAIERGSSHRDSLKKETRSSQDTQPGVRLGTPPPLLIPEKAAELSSSPLSSPPPDTKEPETSSPLSSLPNSPSLPLSASSSSLRSELVIEPSPVRERTNTVMHQAYHGKNIPLSTPSSPSTEPVVVSSSPPLSPSLPFVAQLPISAFPPPTEGFEMHLATDAARKGNDSDSDTDTSSDTSSYLRGEHNDPPLARRAPRSGASRWQDSTAAPSPSILLIDSLPPLLTELFGSGTSDRTTAHRELAQLSRVLTQMTRSTHRPFTVILLNSTTVPSAAKSSDEHLMRSVFADSKAIPSFGAVYDGMCDISFLISKVPKKQEDAEALYARYGEHCSYANVVECLRDDSPDLARWLKGDESEKIRRAEVGRYSADPARRRTNREGRWGGFDVLRVHGEVVVRNPDLSRKLGEYKDFGFGRRP